MRTPLIIQGGMGIAVSNWKLARAVSLLGELGVVSGTALATILVRRLQLGDPDGSMRRALGALPLAGVADRILARYFIEGGKPKDAPFVLTPLQTLDSGPLVTELTVAANFAEVYLAKEGHAGIVGINLLEKVQLPTLGSLYGAMLADVDYVLMGAGIPRAIPGVLDKLAAGEPAELKIDVAGARPGEDYLSRLDPAAFAGAPRTLKRPRFIAIVSSATLAATLAKKSTGRVDGFVVEGALAGGHNAPPRGTLQLDALGQPIYGPRDTPDLPKIRELGLPFWLAGSYARPEKLTEATTLGAAGIQVGTAFAFCEESGIDPDLKRQAMLACQTGRTEILTDPFASPTGFPFKVACLEGTLSDPAIYASRERICDLGYLRQPYRKDDGTVGYRCPGEPVEDFKRKGGCEEDALGRKCLCNGLSATVGFGQTNDGVSEPAIVTAGNDLSELRRLSDRFGERYSAGDLLGYLRAGLAAS